MPTSETFRRAQFQSDLLLFRTFAQSSGLLAENAMSAMLCFSLVATRFVDDFEQDPDTNPYEMLLQAGEARARVEAVVGELESALEHLRRLPLRLDPDGVSPDEEEPEPEDGSEPDEGEPGAPAAEDAFRARPRAEASAVPAAPPRRRKRGQRNRSARPQAPADSPAVAPEAGAEPASAAEPTVEPANGAERAPGTESDPGDHDD